MAWAGTWVGTWVGDWIGSTGGSAPPVVSRQIAVPAQQTTTFALLANQAVYLLPANQQSPITLGASEAMSIQSNLTWYQGEDVTLNFTMTPVVNVTGWTIRLSILNQATNGVVYVASATITGGSTGQFSVLIPNVATASLPTGLYYWDCRREDSGYKATVANGSLILLQAITQ